MPSEEVPSETVPTACLWESDKMDKESLYQISGHYTQYLFVPMPIGNVMIDKIFMESKGETL